MTQRFSRRFHLALAVFIAGMTAAPRGREAVQTPKSQAAGPPPAFEAASVKRSDPSAPPAFRLRIEPSGRFAASQVPLSSLITLAYGIERFHLVGGPDWIDSDRFEIAAEADDVPIRPTPPGTPNRMQLMMRTLLEERFSLVVHRERRELQVSYLVRAREDGKLGERLKVSTVDCAALMAQRARGGGPPPEPPISGEPALCSMMSGTGRIAGSSVTMSALALALASQLNRPVYDRTNLTGQFDFQIEYIPGQTPQIPPGASRPPGTTLPSPDGPSLLSALQEQLGLTLDSTRGPVDVLVIDSVTQPTPD